MSNNDKQAEQDNTAGKAADDGLQRQGVGGGNKVAGGSGPGSDNPALAETYAEESGDISTADFLLARESAEEERLRQEQTQIYADQARSQDPRGRRNTEGGSGQWPADGEQSPAEYMDAPRAESSLLGGSAGSGVGMNTIELEGEVDAMNDRVGADAARNQSPVHLGSPDPADPQADFYTRREYDRDNPPSDLDVLAPGMSYLPPKDKNKGKGKEKSGK
jgi:hypothetical protein